MPPALPTLFPFINVFLPVAPSPPPPFFLRLVPSPWNGRHPRQYHLQQGCFPDPPSDQQPFWSDPHGVHLPTAFFARPEPAAHQPSPTKPHAGAHATPGNGSARDGHAWDGSSHGGTRHGDGNGAVQPDGNAIQWDVPDGPTRECPLHGRRGAGPAPIDFGRVYRDGRGDGCWGFCGGRRGYRSEHQSLSSLRVIVTPSAPFTAPAPHHKQFMCLKTTTTKKIQNYMYISIFKRKTKRKKRNCYFLSQKAFQYYVFFFVFFPFIFLKGGFQKVEKCLFI